jgi:hypothetical protein
MEIMNARSTDKIESLFHKQLSKDELNHFFKELRSNPDLYLKYNSEIALESQIYTLCSNHPQINGLYTEEEWKAIICKAVNEYSNESEIIGTNTYKNSVQKKQPHRDKVIQKTTFFSSSHIRYLIAASLIAAFITSGVVSLFKPNSASISSSLSVFSRNSNERISLIQSIANKDVVESKQFRTDSGDGLLYIDKKTAGFIGTNTKMTYAKKDTSVFLDIASGSVLFTVEKGRYHKFTIITPYAKISVTGTVFRVDALENFTKVSVIEGSVTVQHATNSEEVHLLQGNVAVADTGSVTFFESEKSFSIRLPERKLLDAFLENSINEMSDGILSTDQNHISQMPPLLLNKHLAAADSMCDLYFLTNKNDSVSKVILQSRTYEKKSMYNQAITTGKQFDFLKIKSGFLGDILQFRKGALSLVLGDTADCLKYWSNYQIAYPEGIFSEPVISFLISDRIVKKDFNKADSLLKSFTIKNTATPFVEQVSYCLAEHQRINAQYEQSLYWYEFILDNYSDNNIRSQAAYWVGWSIIQLRTLKTEKRAFSYRSSF